MKKIPLTIASIATASCLGYFAGKGFSVFSKLPTGNAEMASTANQKFSNLKLPALPTAADAYDNLKSLPDITRYLEPFHERSFMHWSPGYSVFTPAFDSHNRPYFRFHDRTQVIPTANGFQTLRDKNWIHFPINLATLAHLYPNVPAEALAGSTQDILWDPKVAVFDADDRMYTVLRMKTSPFTVDRSYVMLYSDNEGLDWSVLPLAGTDKTKCVFKDWGKGTCRTPDLYDLERPYSGKPLEAPPAMLYYMGGKLAKFAKTYSWLGTVGNLYLQPITKNKHGKLKAEEPILISDSAQEIGYRSGSAPKIIHSGSKYFVTWLETNRTFDVKLDEKGQPILPAPDASDNPYSPVWVAEYDSKTRKLTKQPILKTWPVNDSHNQPGIVRSSDGILHVIAGGHGAHFTYSHSLKPDSITEWSTPVPMNTNDTGYKSRYSSPNWTGGSQTYISMMIDSNDVIHTAYRQWVHDKALFDFEYFGALVYQSGNYDKHSKSLTWNKPSILVYPNAQEYTHWYQVMSMDRKDHLYLEYSNMRPYPPYALKLPDGSSSFVSPYLYNAILRSDDSGSTWYLPSDDDFKRSAQ